MVPDISSLPDACGVYLFRSDQGVVLYVGKALSIRARVRSHFNDRSNPKEVKLCSETASVDFVVTGSELEALVLEDTLIKRHLPRFNVRLKDDKSYPYIVITDDDYPSVQQVRGLRPGAGEHFGPHGDPAAVRRSLRWIRKYFPVRSCRRDLSRPSRPCLEFHLGRCMAPCRGDVDRSEYGKAVEGLRRFISGRGGDLLSSLEKEMWQASSEGAYERAALMRDLIGGMRRMREGQKVVLMKGGDLDVVHVNANAMAATVLKVREGRVIEVISFFLESEEPLGGCVEDFITRYYSVSGQVPSRVSVDPLPLDEDAVLELESFLTARSGRKVEIRKVRGRDQRALLDMAQRNTEVFVSMKERVGLSRVPRTIEGFDVSHLSGKGTVASMVHFRMGRPLRSNYRRFKMASERNDDTSSMTEAVSRRLRGLKERKEPFPDLLLIDGGLGQLNAVLNVLEAYDIKERPEVAALAKREESLFIPGRSAPLRLARSDPVLRLLMRVRDESHRFALSYQRKLRTLDLELLMGVPGIGGARARRIMTEFESLEAALEAGPEGLSERCSIPLGPAKAVWEAIRTRGRKQH